MSHNDIFKGVDRCLAYFSSLVWP